MLVHKYSKKLTNNIYINSALVCSGKKLFALKASLTRLMPNHFIFFPHMHAKSI